MPDQSEQSESESEEELYHVEVITKARVSEDGDWEYHVKWAGYGSDADSWEPERNVQGCERLLSSFWDNVGMDDGDYDPGYVTEARPAWIRKEREFFHKNFGKNEQERKRLKELEKKKKKHKGFSVSASNSKRSTEKESGAEKIKKLVRKINGSDDDSDDRPLSGSIKPGSSLKRNQGRDTISISDSESDAPLSTQRKASGSGIGMKRKATSTSPLPNSTRKVSSRERPPKLLKTSSSARDVRPPETSSRGVARAATPSRSASSSPPGSPTSLFSANSPSHPQSPLPPAPSAQRTAKPSTTQKPPITARKPIKGTYNDKHIPGRIQRWDNPQLASGSTLTTKQRVISEGSKSFGHAITPRAGLLSRLSFKKKPPRTQELIAQPTSQPRPLPAGPVATTQPDPSRVYNAPDPIQSPVHTDDYQDYGGGMGMDIHLTEPRNTLSTSREPMAAVLEFLDSVPKNSLSRPSAPALKSSTSSTYRIPRKFKWVGEIFINTERDRAERLCNAMLSNLTEGIPNGSRFSYHFDDERPVDSMRLAKLLHISDFSLLQSACMPIAQMAKFGPVDDKDVEASEAFQTLNKYMSPRRLVTYVILHSHQTDLSALMLVIPSTSAELCHEFKVPMRLQNTGAFVAALIPWAMSEKEAVALRIWRTPEEKKMFSQLVRNSEPISDPPRVLRGDPMYHRALHILKFPKWLHDHMSQPDRMYCIWNFRGDHSQEEFETIALRSILKRCGARDVGLNTHARIVFVHVGSLTTLSKLPTLTERRKKFSHTQFFTYGTHQSVSSKRWGVREIYPLGGIVTFTPAAFKDHPFAVYRLISMIEEHPLWDCYITPSLLAMLARDTCGSEPLIKFEQGSFAYADLLKMVEAGELSLLSTPPISQSNSRQVSTWVSWQTELPLLQARDILERCLRSFVEQHTELPEEQWSSSVEREILTSLASIQLQPAVMDNYRRFIVLDGQQGEGHTPGGVEWIPLSQFDFKDEFFPDVSSQLLQFSVVGDRDEPISR